MPAHFGNCGNDDCDNALAGPNDEKCGPCRVEERPDDYEPTFDKLTERLNR